jgi:hypothetical protein
MDMSRLLRGRMAELLVRLLALIAATRGVVADGAEDVGAMASRDSIA